MPRVKTTLLLDPEFKSFLESLKETTGTAISRIVEKATIAQYKNEYAKFKKSKKNKPDEGKQS